MCHGSKESTVFEHDYFAKHITELTLRQLLFEGMGRDGRYSSS